MSLAVKLCGNVFAHDAPHLVVVGAHEGRIFPGVGLAFKDDDGNAAVVGAVDGGCNGLHLVGCHNQQVDAGGEQTVNLLYLPLVAVVGRRKAQFDILVGVGRHAHFGILLLAPDVG